MQKVGTHGEKLQSRRRDLYSFLSCRPSPLGEHTDHWGNQPTFLR